MYNMLSVSVLVVTYNQAKYVRQILDAILEQKTTFPIEILVHDDCSQDGTVEIIQEYVEKYPDTVKAFFETENQYSQGNINEVIYDMYSKCRGKYIAQCEGDDYWCDENKLQKQVDFLEANPDYSICYHPAKMIYEFGDKPSEILAQTKRKNPQSYQRLLEENYIPANSVVYRAEVLKEGLATCPHNTFPLDWYTHLLVGKNHKIGYLPDIMYVYRRQEGGITHTASENPLDELRLRHGIKEVNFYYAVWKLVQDIAPNYYKDKFIPSLREVSFTYLKYCKLDELKQLFETYGEHFGELKYPNYAEEGRLRKRFKRYKRYFNIVLIISILLFTLSLALGIYAFKF